jgi:hypothetical protein
MTARLEDDCMTEATQENPLEEIKEKLNEVIELLNQPNLPIAVTDDTEAAKPIDPKE